jgi:hypothetical protein
MPSSLTKLGVWNLAIDVIKDTALQTTGDTAATARWLERNWQHIVETTLRAYPWNFAKELHELSADADTPPFKWSYFYSPPAGWLRVLPITQGGRRDGRIVPHELIGQRIAANYGPPLPVTLIMDKSSNPGEWDSLFTEMVRCKLALGMANKFTSKSKYIELASQMLNAATEQAEQIDAFEGTGEPIEQHDIILSRHATTPYLPGR